MSQSLDHAPGRGLHVFAVLAAACTLPLIFMGGLVTSHDAALAVPDWPNSFGYNMFFFPWSKMVGGIFYEHSHRLVASAVGFLTIILAVWLWFKESRRWLVRLGFLALALVILQGVLGGLRVVLLKKWIAIFHACLAQGFFCLLAAIALFTSSWWKSRERTPASLKDWGMRKLAAWGTILIFIQLVLGAAMRHTDSGLAVTDFPLVYGKLTPPMDAAALEHVNNQRWHLGLDPVSMKQIVIHLAHRMGAIVVSVMVLAALWKVRRRYWDCRELRLLALILTGLLLIQLGLGMSVIWTQKAADIATAHVAVGALTLMVSFLLTLVAFKLIAVNEAREPAAAAAGVVA